MTNEQKLIEIATAAHLKRGELIQMYRDQKHGNVKIELPHGCTYVYGETIPQPTIHFLSGDTIHDMELFDKTIWSKAP